MSAVWSGKDERGGDGRDRERTSGERGAVTAEAGICAVAAVTFAAILFKIITAPTMNDLLEDLFGGALSALF